MTRQEIEAIEQGLPKPNPYTRYLSLSRLTRPELSDMFSPSTPTLMNPSFGWDLSKSFAEEGQNLPEWIKQTALHRANRHLLEPNCPDINIVMAQMLSLPENEPQRELLHGLLVCEDSTIESVAKLCRYEPDVIALFDGLFCNLSDRRTEWRYVSRFFKESPDCNYTDQSSRETAIDLVRLAYRVKRVDLVLAAAELSSVTGQMSRQKSYQQIRSNYLRSALAGLAIQKMNSKENPALEPSLKMIKQSHQKEEPFPERPARMTPSQAIQSAIDKVADKNAAPTTWADVLEHVRRTSD